MWWMYALLSAFFAALTAILAKIGIKGMDTDWATAIRTGFVLVLAWSIVAIKGNVAAANGISKQNWIFLALSGLATGFSWIFYYKALSLGKVSQVAPVDKLSVALAMILSVIFLGEVLDWKTILGAGLIIAGTIIVIL